MKDGTEKKEPEKVKKEVSTPCTITCMFRNYGMEKLVFEVSIIYINLFINNLFIINFSNLKRMKRN